MPAEGHSTLKSPSVNRKTRQSTRGDNIRAGTWRTDRHDPSWALLRIKNLHMVGMDHNQRPASRSRPEEEEAQEDEGEEARRVHRVGRRSPPVPTRIMPPRRRRLVFLEGSIVRTTGKNSRRGKR